MSAAGDALRHAALAGAGGALGAAARVLLGRAVQQAAGGAFPWGTLAVNVLGCLAFGLVLGAVPVTSPAAARVHSFVLAGVLGGFTTFSAFSHETVLLARSGHAGAAGLYVAASVTTCLLATAGGLLAAQRLLTEP